MTQDFCVIGLTGPSGAGKSTLASLLAEYRIPVIDADGVYHALLIPPSPCLEALAAEFTTDILASDGTLNRTALAALVFEDSESGRRRQKRLNAITHRFVTEKVHQYLNDYRAAGVRAVVIDAPLLIEAGLHRDCTFTVCVLAPKEVRLHRLMARDGKDEAAICARINAQPDDEFYRSHTDAVIFNGSDSTVASHDNLRKQLEDVLRRAGVRNDA